MANFKERCLYKKLIRATTKEMEALKDEGNRAVCNNFLNVLKRIKTQGNCCWTKTRAHK